MDWTALKPDDLAFVESQLGLPPRELADLPDAELSRAIAARQGWVEFWNAAQDFVTVVLLTDLIEHDEDWVRVELVRIVHLLEGAAVRDAIYGTDEMLEERYAKLRDSLTELLILRYLRATRCPVSATEECRTHWWGYPSSPPKSCQRQFQEIIQSVRMRGPVPA
jgi:hypothetical protein